MFKIVRRMLASDSAALQKAKVNALKILSGSQQNDDHCALYHLARAAENPGHKMPSKFATILANYGLTSSHGAVDQEALPIVLGAVKINKAGLAVVDLNDYDLE